MPPRREKNEVVMRARDGESHSMGDRPDRDQRRDQWLRGQGLRVLRFAAADVIKDLDSVVTAILFACRS